MAHLFGASFFFIIFAPNKQYIKMAKKLSVTILLALLCAVSFAVPAKRGVYKMIKLADGTEVRAELRGDEHVNYWQTADGRNFVMAESLDCYVEADVQQMTERYLAEKNQLQTSVSSPRRAAGVQPSSPIVGARKGIIVLVNFADVKFQEGHDAAYFERVANELNFSNEDGYVGSVRDYYLAQSDDQLDYTFDVIGPVDISQNMAYYGGHSGEQNDKNMKAFVKETTDLIKDQITFADYDNDGDGEVDNIFFIYAGYEEADGGGDDCIWPHMYYYPYLGLNYSQNGTSFNVYACSSELQYDGRMGGIGAICHEFSHCLGLPDLYDTGSAGNYGMDYWSIMHGGCYLGDSFRPCGYTAYERNYCGWRTINTLQAGDTVENLAGISEGGQGYKFANDKYSTEYYLLEARSKSGWDVELPGEGLMITHVDFNSTAWRSNKVNNTSGHQRCAIVAADDSYGATWADVKGDLFPSKTNRFSDATTPQAFWFNNNKTGNKKFGHSVYNIKKDAENHTVSFSFMKGTYVYEPVVPEGAVFYESFDDCWGAGGNDGVFTSASGTGDFNPDLEGWTTTNKTYGCCQCAMFGGLTGTTTVTTPAFNVNGEATLTFKACNFNTDAKSIKVTITTGGEAGEPVSFSLTRKQWNDCEVKFTGNGETTITFTATKRFYLDEVLVMPADPSGIESVEADNNSNNDALYNLAGQKVGSDYRGIVIRNGRKFIK